MVVSLTTNPSTTPIETVAPETRVIARDSLGEPRPETTTEAVTVDSSTESTESTKASRAKKKSKKKAKKKADEAAAEKIEREIRQDRNKRIVFWASYVIVGGFIALTAVTGTLVRTDVWASLVWLLPFITLAAPFIVGLLRKEKLGDIVKNGLFSIVISIVLFVSFLVTIFSGLSDDIWALIIGNESMNGSTGIWLALGSFLSGVWVIGGLLGWLVPVLGWFINFGLVFVLPAALFINLVRATYRTDLVRWKTLLLAICTPLGFILPIGQSIIINAGF